VCMHVYMYDFNACVCMQIKITSSALYLGSGAECR